jgi:hypothetical protein
MGLRTCSSQDYLFLFLTKRFFESTKTGPKFSSPLKCPKIIKKMLKNSNFFPVSSVFIYGMRKSRNYERTQIRRFLLFTPSFYEGFTIDPLIF